MRTLRFQCGGPAYLDLPSPDQRLRLLPSPLELWEVTGLCKWSTYGFCSCKTEQLLWAFSIISCLVVLWCGWDDYTWKVPCDWQTSVPLELIRAPALEDEITLPGAKKKKNAPQHQWFSRFIWSHLCFVGETVLSRKCTLLSWSKQDSLLLNFDFKTSI